VFHLAAARSAKTSDRAEFYAVNIEGMRTVADAAIAAGVQRFVHASTMGVYGLMTRGVMTEQNPLRPNNHYRLSKTRAEQELVARGGRLPYVIARLSSIIGPAAKSWLNFYRAGARDDFRLIGAGNNLVQLGHAKDAADGLLRCAEMPGIAGEAFNLSGTAPIPVREFARLIREEAGVRADIRHLPGAPYYAHARLADVAFRSLRIEIPYSNRYQLFIAQAAYDLSKAERMLGYAPRMTTSECVRWTANYFRESGWL
jgi:nucleoside-diphosphate-sugar epimerase